MIHDCTMYSLLVKCAICTIRYVPDAYNNNISELAINGRKRKNRIKSASNEIYS